MAGYLDDNDITNMPQAVAQRARATLAAKEAAEAELEVLKQVSAVLAETERTLQLTVARSCSSYASD